MTRRSADIDCGRRLGDHLPALYQEDDFTMRFLGGLDQVLAPVIATLDSLPAYIDPMLAPADFLAWVASWTGLDVEHMTADDRKRALVRSAAGLYRGRGTVSALRDLVSAFTGTSPEIEETGGTSWSREPGTAPPGEAVAAVRVRVRSEETSLDAEHLAGLLRSAIPAHVRQELEVEP